MRMFEEMASGVDEREGGSVKWEMGETGVV
jgi:hypothetical protein